MQGSHCILVIPLSILSKVIPSPNDIMYQLEWVDRYSSVTPHINTTQMLGKTADMHVQLPGLLRGYGTGRRITILTKTTDSLMEYTL